MRVIQPEKPLPPEDLKPELEHTRDLWSLDAPGPLLPCSAYGEGKRLAVNMSCIQAHKNDYEANIASTCSSVEPRLGMQCARSSLSGVAIMRYVHAIRRTVSIYLTEALRRRVSWHHSMDTAIHQP